MRDQFRYLLFGLALMVMPVKAVAEESWRVGKTFGGVVIINPDRSWTRAAAGAELRAGQTTLVGPGQKARTKADGLLAVTGLGPKYPVVSSPQRAALVSGAASTDQASSEDSAGQDTDDGGATQTTKGKDGDKAKGDKD